MKLTEDTLVQQTTAEYLHEALKWDITHLAPAPPPRQTVGRESAQPHAEQDLMIGLRPRCSVARRAAVQQCCPCPTSPTFIASGSSIHT